MSDLLLGMLAFAIGCAVDRSIRQIRYPERLWVAGTFIASIIAISFVVSATMPPV